MKRGLFAIAFAAVGCQTYDFEPVTPLAIGQTTQSKNIVAHPLKPNVMLLIDKSGSMLTNTSTAAPCPSTIGGCGAVGGACPPGCPTRISDLKSAMSDFLTDPLNTGSATAARVGAAFFPKDSVCGATSQSEILVPLLGPALSDDDNVLKMQSGQVNTAINGLGTPAGGTPTADSLRFVGNLEELQDTTRDNFVLLLTDGVPNCNLNNPNNSCSANNAACNCTTSSCAPGTPFCAEGCLNADDSVNAIKELVNKDSHIRTIVVGFGACGQIGNTSPDCANAPQTLNQMARAGQFARNCATDADCQKSGGTDTCDVASGFCNQSYFAAANAADLSAQLLAISQIFDPKTICNFRLLTAPSDPRFLSVTVAGKTIQGCGESIGGAAVPGCNTWTYDLTTALPSITFQGTTCDQVKAATPQAAVNVQVRIVSSL